MLKKPRWIVTVRREGAEEVTATRWLKKTDETGLSDGQYGNVATTLTNDVREDVYEQIVEDLDLLAVIRAVNRMGA